MRLRFGQLRRLLDEAVARDGASRFNPKSLKPVVDEMKGELEKTCARFLDDEFQDPESSVESIDVLDRTKSGLGYVVYVTFSEMVEILLEFEPNGSPMEWIARFGGGSAPEHHHTDEEEPLVRETWELWNTRPTFEKACIEALQPPVDDSGTWWADDNYYLIRPMWKGEELGLKPDPSWTVVNGTTGDVIKEAREDKRIRLVRYDAVEKMNARAGKRVLQFIKDINEDPNRGRIFANKKYTNTEHTYDVRISNYGASPDYWEIKAQANLRDPMRPLLLVRNVGRYMPDAPSAVIEKYREAFEAVIMPKPIPSGAWWADENSYTVRPIYEGEDVSKPPVETWTAIDPTTYEPVTEGTLNEAHPPKSDEPPFFHRGSVDLILRAALENVEEWIVDFVPRGCISSASVRWDGGTAGCDIRLKTCAENLTVMVRYDVAKSHDRDTVRIHPDLTTVLGWDPEMSYEEAQEHNPSFTDDAINEIDAFLAELKEQLDPRPEEHDEWWADKDYYPIRPLVQGEEADKKPDPSWTVVKGSTGDVVSEAKQTSKAGNHIHMYNKKPVSVAAARATLDAVKDLLAEPRYADRFDVALSPKIRIVGGVRRVVFGIMLSGDMFGFLEGYVSLGDLFHPNISMTAGSQRRMSDMMSWKGWRDDWQQLKADLKPIVGPRPDKSGLWWADENMYLLRPLFEDESPRLRPLETWVAVDPTTYEDYSGGYAKPDKFTF